MRASTSMAKIAGFMQKMNIECNPANFELLFAVMSGENPELREEFSKLDKKIQQDDLDSLISKHIPHHKEDDIATQSIDDVSGELDTFMGTVKSETAALAKFDKVLSSQKQALQNSDKISAETLQKTLSTISAATEQKISENKQAVANIQKQTQRLDTIATGLNNYKEHKFKDPLTGFANRRALNKQLATIYDNGRIKDCALAIMEIDSFTMIRENFGTDIADDFIKHIGSLIEQNSSQNDYVARAGSSQFAWIFHKLSGESAKSAVDKLRLKITQSPLLDKESGQLIGRATISAGICSSNQTKDSSELVSKTEFALHQSKDKNGNQSTLFAKNNTAQQNTNYLERTGWMLYET